MSYYLSGPEDSFHVEQEAVTPVQPIPQGASVVSQYTGYRPGYFSQQQQPMIFRQEPEEYLQEKYGRVIPPPITYIHPPVIKPQPKPVLPSPSVAKKYVEDALKIAKQDYRELQARSVGESGSELLLAQRKINELEQIKSKISAGGSVVSGNLTEAVSNMLYTEKPSISDVINLPPRFTDDTKYVTKVTGPVAEAKKEVQKTVGNSFLFNLGESLGKAAGTVEKWVWPGSVPEKKSPIEAKESMVSKLKKMFDRYLPNNGDKVDVNSKMDPGYPGGIMSSQDRKKAEEMEKNDKSFLEQKLPFVGLKMAAKELISGGGIYLPGVNLGSLSMIDRVGGGYILSHVRPELFRMEPKLRVIEQAMNLDARILDSVNKLQKMGVDARFALNAFTPGIGYNPQWGHEATVSVVKALNNFKAEKLKEAGEMAALGSATEEQLSSPLAQQLVKAKSALPIVDKVAELTKQIDALQSDIRYSQYSPEGDVDLANKQSKLRALQSQQQNLLTVVASGQRSRPLNGYYY